MHLPNSLSASSAAAIVGLVTSALPMRRNHLSCNEDQSPEAEAARSSLLWSLVGRRFFVLSVLETSGLAFVRVVEDMAEA